jgi:hypothetical protein
MMGSKNIQEISQSVQEAFDSIENPMDEVLSIARQLQKSGFL